MMAATHPDKIWWTAREIADAKLPDMPRSMSGVDVMVKRLGWRSDPKNARQRARRGGGWEYNWGLFSTRARRKLLSEAAGSGSL